MKKKQEQFSFFCLITLIIANQSAAVFRHLRASGNEKSVIAISSHDKGNSAILAAGANVVCSKMEFRRINDVIAGLKT